MRHCSKCLEDIEAALMFGYPEDMQYKLMDRRGRCLLRGQRVTSVWSRGHMAPGGTGVSSVGGADRIQSEDLKVTSKRLALVIFMFAGLWPGDWQGHDPDPDHLHLAPR